ncbi:MAG TPA: hypothetical protein VI076_04275, partial [Actinopolymorphaceae bacterium]
VSVVGDFNNWVAGQHPLRLSPDGNRKVSVIVGPGPHYFRYLASDNEWRDDPDADYIDEHGSVVYTAEAGAHQHDGYGQASVVQLPGQASSDALNSVAAGH